METDALRIQKDIENLSCFTATPGCGVTRLSFTPEDRGAREYIKKAMEEAGLAVREDAAGTVVGRREGRVEGPVVMVGSHFDSVKCGGAFDGTAGVVAALEIARVMKEVGVSTVFPVEFVAMVEEEGTRFGAGLFGSRAMAGAVSEQEVKTHKDDEGVTLAQAMQDFGLEPALILKAARDPSSLQAFFELHVEQGPVLEREGFPLGIVESIVGMNTYEVCIEGKADHAGTTPLDMRSDALLAASKVVGGVRRIAGTTGGGAVGTVGKVEVLPGASNVVPGKVNFTVDLRSQHEGDLRVMEEMLLQLLGDVCGEEGSGQLVFTLRRSLSAKPARLSERLRGTLESEARRRSIKPLTMASGAGHDTQIMATLTEAALVFVPSKGGRSHCPEEWTDYEDIKTGADVILGAVLATAKSYEG